MEEEQSKVNAGNSPPLSGILSTLLSNPDLLKRVGTIISAAQSTPQDAPGHDTTEAAESTDTERDTPVTSTAQNESHPTGGSADGLSALLGDPAMLEKLPQMIAAMKPLLESMPQQKPPKEESPASPELCRDHLLLALKPFLSPERREAVDSIIRISKLGAVFKQLK